MGPYTVAAGGKWVVRGWRERAKGRLMKRLHTHTQSDRDTCTHICTHTRTHTHSLSGTETQDNEQVFGPLKAPEAPGSSNFLYAALNWRENHALSLARTLLLTVSRGLSLYSSLPTLSFLLFFFSRWFYIFPPHFFSTASLPPFLSLSLSYSTNCCWSSVFCVAREIFQCALAWRTMACLSCEQQRLGDMPWITLTFQ